MQVADEHFAVFCLSGYFLGQAAFPWCAVSTLPGKISHGLSKQLLRSE